MQDTLVMLVSFSWVDANLPCYPIHGDHQFHAVQGDARALT